MKQKRLKNYLKIGILLFGISVFLTNCEKEDFKENNANPDHAKSNLDWYRTDSKTILNENKELKEHLSTRFSSKDNSPYSKMQSEEYNFSIDESYVQVISSNNYESYTFLVEKESYNPDFLENYVYTSFSNGGYSQMLISYPIIYSNGMASYDIANSTANYIQDEGLIYSVKSGISPCNNTTEEIIEWDENAGECVDYNCTAGGNHAPGQSCNGDEDEQPYTECTGGWVVTGCIQFGGGGSSGTGAGSSGGGGSSGGNGSNNDNPDNTVAITPLAQDQINQLKQQTRNGQVKARIEQMEEDLNTATKEQGSEFRRNTNVPRGGNLYSEYQIPASQTTFSGTRFPNVLANSEIRVHLHHNSTNTDGEKLAPIFSLDDVFGMSEFYKQVTNANMGTLSFNINNISSIMVSRRGLYALKVNDADEVLEFNEYLTNGLTNNDGQTYIQFLTERFNREVINLTLQQCGNCSDAQEEALFELNFVNFFKKLDSGLNLFVSYGTDENGDYIWTFLTN